MGKRPKPTAPLTPEQKQLALDNLRLLRKAGRKMATQEYWIKGSRREEADILSAAALGYIHACQNYRPETNNKFSSYAWKCMFGYVRSYLDKTSKVIKPLSTESGYRQATVLLATDHPSLWQALSGDRFDSGSRVGAPRWLEDVPCYEDDQDVNLRHEDDRRRLERLLSEIDPRGQDILWGRAVEERTLEDLGDRYGVSRERIRQLEFNALHKLREAHGNSAQA